MAFSFAELLKKQFPLAGVEAYTGSPKRMPESSPFPSSSALGALGMGGALDALGSVSMADYFNNDNWETRQIEGVSKRGEMVDRQYRMSPGDKTTIKVGNDGKIVETTERTTGDLFSEQPNRSDYPVKVSLPSQRGSEFDPRMSGDLFPQQPNRSINSNQIDEWMGLLVNDGYRDIKNESIAQRNPPVFQGMPFTEYDAMAKTPIGNFDRVVQPGTASNVGADRMGQTNYVYPNNSNAYNTSNISNSGRSMYNRSGYSVDPALRRNYSVPKYGQARPTSAQTFPIINSLLVPELDDTVQSEMNRLPMLINQGEDGVFPPIGPNVYGLDEGMFNEDPDDERRRLLGELLRQYYQENPRTYTSSI